MSDQPRLAEDTALPPPIPATAQLDVVRRLKDHYDRFTQQIKPLHEKIDRWHELYEAQKKGPKNFPWPGAANYQVPLAMATVDSIHSRISKAVFDVDPLWLTKPRSPGSVMVAKKSEWYMDYWADEMALPEKLDASIHNMLVEGVGIIRADWDRRTRQIPGVARPDPMTGAMAAPKGPEQVTEYEGPAVRPVPLKDYVHIPADAPTIEDAVYVGHRVFRTYQQLKDRERSGIYFNVDALLEKTSGDSTTDRTPNPSNVLTLTDYSGEYEETRQYEVVELYGPYDWGDGPVPTLFAFSPQHSILLRIEPYPYEYGRAPYLSFAVYPRPNFFWARSLVEMLESAQEELSALHNMRADAVARRIAPPLLRRTGARWDPKEKPWAPGHVIDVNDTSELIELSMSDVPHSLFAHEQDILNFTERMTGMSDVFMGRTGSPYTTATAVNRSTSEGLARMDTMVSRYQAGMKKLAWVVYWLLYQYRPYLDAFLIEGQEYTITKDEMRPTQNGLMPFEFVPHGMLSDSSKEARRSQLTFMYQAVAPQLAQFYPDGIQKVLDELLASYDIQNRKEILGPPWSVIQQQLQQAFMAGQQEGMKQAAAAPEGA